jgi:hypothetical protein
MTNICEPALVAQAKVFLVASLRSSEAGGYLDT